MGEVGIRSTEHALDHWFRNLWNGVPPPHEADGIPSLFRSPFGPRILAEFSPASYRRANPDLARQGLDDAALRTHFISSGYDQRRPFDEDRADGIDLAAYRSGHPPFRAVSDQALRIHYQYVGQFLREPEVDASQPDSLHAAWRRDFRWTEYVAANPDLEGSFPDADAAFHHFFEVGRHEGRLGFPWRARRLDPRLYRSRHAHLMLESADAAQRHFCHHGYYLGLAANEVEAWLQDVDLHVFQMGKVGSHSIAAAIAADDSGVQALNLHRPVDLQFAYPGVGVEYPSLIRRRRKRPLRIVSGVRDIVSWGLSSIFQTGDAEGHLRCRDDADFLVGNGLADMCRVGMSWFDHQYYAGIDVYAHPFDHRAGWQRIDAEGISLLIYRVEDLTRLGEVIADFLGCARPLAFPRENDGTKKGSGAAYRDFVRDFRLPERHLRRLLDSRYMRHFYSEVERGALLRRWQE